MYNSAKFIEDTIESVLTQEYTDWELILADDGSSDDTQAIAKKYADQYPDKIKYAEHPNNLNKGASATRNLAISLAKGDLIALIDSDDLWKSNYLKEQVKTLEDHPEAEVVCEATLYWNSWSDPSAEDYVINVGVPINKIYRPPFLAYTLYPLGKGAAPCMCAIVMRIDAIKKIGGFEDAFEGKIQLYEDQAFDVKNYLHNTIYFTDRANNIYRQRPDSLMHSLIDEGLYNHGRSFFLRWLKDYVERNNISNKRIKYLLRRGLILSRFPYLHHLSTSIKDRCKQFFQFSFAK